MPPEPVSLSAWSRLNTSSGVKKSSILVRSGESLTIDSCTLFGDPYPAAVALECEFPVVKSRLPSSSAAMPYPAIQIEDKKKGGCGPPGICGTGSGCRRLFKWFEAKGFSEPASQPNSHPRDTSA